MNLSWLTYRFRKRAPRSYVVSRPLSVSSPSWLSPYQHRTGAAPSGFTRYRPLHHQLQWLSQVHRLHQNVLAFSSIVVSSNCPPRGVSSRRIAAAGLHYSMASMVQGRPGLCQNIVTQVTARIHTFWKRTETGALSPCRSRTCTRRSSRSLGYSLSSSSWVYAGLGTKVVILYFEVSWELAKHSGPRSFPSAVLRDHVDESQINGRHGWPGIGPLPKGALNATWGKGARRGVEEKSLKATTLLLEHTLGT